MKILLLIGFVLPATLLASTPDYGALSEDMRSEREDRETRVREEIPLGSVRFGGDATIGDIEDGQRETGEFLTPRERIEGARLREERERADSIEWYSNALTQIEEWEDTAKRETERLLRHADGDESNGGMDSLAHLNQSRADLAGPMGEEVLPPFADESSDTLDPTVDPDTQKGDSCMDNTGNSSQMSVAPISDTYPDGCEGVSEAEYLDCMRGAKREITAESKGGSATSEKVFEGTQSRKTDQLGSMTTAGVQNITSPSCPTQPRLAETVMPNVENLMASERGDFEQSSLIPGRTTTALAWEDPNPTLAELTVPWYKRLLAFVFPETVMAQSRTGTLRGSTFATGRANELRALEYQQFNQDLIDYADTQGEQQFFNTNARRLEQREETLQTQLQLTALYREYLQEIANKETRPY